MTRPRPVTAPGKILSGVLMALVTLTGCAKSQGGGSQSSPVAACTKAGDRCEYAPGKIGLCTTKPDCVDGSCLTCVSLH